MDRGEAGVTADQYLRVSDVLSDVSAEPGREDAFQSVPDVELCIGWFLQTSSSFVRAVETRCACARSTDDAGWEVHGGICGMPGELRNGAGNDGERRFLRGRLAREGGRTDGEKMNWLP